MLMKEGYDTGERFSEAIGIVERNRSVLTPQESELLLRHITAAYVLQRVTEMVNRSLEQRRHSR